MSCNNKIKAVYFLNRDDAIYENGVFVRLKRIYGKFKRKVIKIDYEKS